MGRLQDQAGLSKGSALPTSHRAQKQWLESHHTRMTPPCSRLLLPALRLLFGVWFDLCFSFSEPSSPNSRISRLPVSHQASPHLSHFQGAPYEDTTCHPKL